VPVSASSLSCKGGTADAEFHFIRFFHSMCLTGRLIWNGYPKEGVSRCIWNGIKMVITDPGAVAFSRRAMPSAIYVLAKAKAVRYLPRRHDLLELYAPIEHGLQ
jgi:hypothetical protein